jgi:pyroglutamyl-peptidase
LVNLVRAFLRDGDGAFNGVCLRGPQTLIQAFEQSRPDAVLCLGEASKRMAISIERVAINLMDYRNADNDGNQIMDEPIVRDGPAAYFVTLPARAMLDAVRATGVPAELSLSAGAFLCNQVTYVMLHHLAKQIENFRRLYSFARAARTSGRS